MNKINLLLLASFVSSAAFAQTNYITCDTDLGDKKTQCHLNAAVVKDTDLKFEGERYEADFLINANATCNSEVRRSGFFVAVGKSDSRSSELNLGAKKVIRLTGVGPMRLFRDDIVDRVTNSYVTRDCGLFLEVSHQPSQFTIKKWEAQANEILSILSAMTKIYYRKSEALNWYEDFKKAPEAKSQVLKDLQVQFISESTQSSLVDATAIQYILDKSPRESIENLYKKYKNRIAPELAGAELALKRLNFIKSSHAVALAAALEAAKKVN